MRKRDFARMARYNAEKQKEHIDEMQGKIHKDGGEILDYRVDKAITSTAPKDDAVMTTEPKDDAAYRVVNHAHQRRPDKKWS